MNKNNNIHYKKDIYEMKVQKAFSSYQFSGEAKALFHIIFFK